MIPWSEIINFLEKRRGLLDAVVFSGGEPTLQRTLSTAIEQVKAMGYKIGLHTGGPYPARLRRLLPTLDWVGLDIKATQENYAKITGVEDSGSRAWESARILLESDIPHEIRTTVHPLLISPGEQAAIKERLARLGASRYRAQECVTERCLDPTLR
jgi:pyruvate formate lyase activating enzyme